MENVMKQIDNRKTIHKYIKDVPMVVEDMMGITQINDFVKSFNNIHGMLESVHAEPECYLFVDWIMENNNVLELKEDFSLIYAPEKDKMVIETNPKQYMLETMPEELYKLFT